MADSSPRTFSEVDENERPISANSTQSPLDENSSFLLQLNEHILNSRKRNIDGKWPAPRPLIGSEISNRNLSPNVLVELLDLRHNLDRLAMCQIRERLDHMAAVLRGGKPPRPEDLDHPSNLSKIGIGSPSKPVLAPMNHSSSSQKGSANPWGADLGVHRFKPGCENDEGESSDNQANDTGDEKKTETMIKPVIQNKWSRLKMEQQKEKGMLALKTNSTKWFPQALNKRREILKEIFEMFDEDENGTISLEELAMVYKHFGV
jgi:hypothetical protein